MNCFDDLLAAVLLYCDAWENVKDPDGVTLAWELLRAEVKGAGDLTSRERERLFRDAAIREAATRGDAYSDIAWNYGCSPALVSRIACAGGIRRRAMVAPAPAV